MIREEGSRHFHGMLPLLLLTAALGLLLYPAWSDALQGVRQTTELMGGERLLQGQTGAELRRLLLQAEAYNREIAREQKQAAFSYRGEDATDAAYERALRIGNSDVMGDLLIPRIHLHLPIAHGTHAEDLEYRCGHMYGTSLPVGGPDAHAVLAGHTGLPGAALFTHLRELETGDLFYLRVLGETHCYEIQEINVVWPEEESAYLGVEEGRDLVTLYTCTPYGINNRRLLVRGERRQEGQEEGAETGDILQLTVWNREAVLKTAGLSAICPALFAMGFLWHRKRLQRRRKETR